MSNFANLFQKSSQNAFAKIIPEKHQTLPKIPLISKNSKLSNSIFKPVLKKFFNLISSLSSFSKFKLDFLEFGFFYFYSLINLLKFLVSSFANFTKKSVQILILGIFLSNLPGSFFSLSKVETLAQSSQNTIDLKISKVTKDGQTLDTKLSSRNNWTFDDGALGDLDNIRYAWTGAILNTENEQVPILAGGFLKIYLGDDSKEENLLLKYGQSPLPINLFSSRLATGDNKLLFVYIDHTNKPNSANTKVAFNFKYNPTVNKPKINVIEPTENAVFRANSVRNFSVQLDNFSLSENGNNNPSIGQLKLFANTVKEENLIGNWKTSKEIGPSSQIVDFNSDSFNKEKFVKLPDSRETKLIFVLARPNGENLDVSFVRQITTNFAGSIAIEQPKISIIEPRKDRNNLNVDGNISFLLKVENFEILKERQTGANEEGKGYLQIFVNNQPIKTIWGKMDDFSLNEIGYKDDKEGKKEVKVQLVNKDFTKLNPEATDSVSIVYQPPVKASNPVNQEINDQPENSVLRIVVVSLIVILFIGGVVILVTKG